MDQMGAATCEQMFREAGGTVGRQDAADDGATLMCSFLENGPMSLFQEKKPQQTKAQTKKLLT